MKPIKKKAYQFLFGLSIGGMACLGVAQAHENLYVSVSWGKPASEFAGLEQQVATHRAELPIFMVQSDERAKYEMLMARLNDNIDEGLGE